MKIEILGVGCARCRQLAANADEAARALGLDYQLEKVTDISRILASGVLVTPALVVDGQMRLAGRVPGVEELKQLLAT